MSKPFSWTHYTVTKYRHYPDMEKRTYSLEEDALKWATEENMNWDDLIIVDKIETTTSRIAKFLGDGTDCLKED